MAIKFAIDVPEVVTILSAGTRQCRAIARCSASNVSEPDPLTSKSSRVTSRSDNAHGATPLAARLKRAGFRVFTHWRYSEPNVANMHGILPRLYCRGGLRPPTICMIFEIVGRSQTAPTGKGGGIKSVENAKVTRDHS